MLIAKSFLFGQIGRKNESPFLERMPVVVLFEPNERRPHRSPCFDRPSRNHIHIAIVQQLAESVTAISPVPSEVIPPPGTDECGR